MDKFFEAQQRHATTGAFGTQRNNAVHSYLEDIHRTYGMLKGAPSRDSVNASASKNYQSLQQYKSETDQMIRNLQSDCRNLASERDRWANVAKRLSDHIDSNNDYVARGGGGGGNDDGGDRGGGVLSPVHTDAQIGKQAISNEVDVVKTEDDELNPERGAGGHPSPGGGGDLQFDDTTRNEEKASECGSADPGGGGDRHGERHTCGPGTGDGASE